MIVQRVVPYAAALVFALSFGGHRGAVAAGEDGARPVLPGIVWQAMPSAPLALAAVEQDGDLAGMLQESIRERQPFGRLCRWVATAAPQNAKAALFSMLLKVAELTPAREQGWTATWVLTRSPKVFDVMPRGILYITSPPEAPLTEHWLGRLRPAPGYRYSTEGGDSGDAPVLHVAQWPGLCIVAEDQATLDAARAAAARDEPLAVPAALAAVRSQAPGPAWFFLDGALLLLMPFVGIEGVTEDWLTDLEDVSALGLGFEPYARLSRHALTLYVHLAAEPRGLGALLRTVRLRLAADGPAGDVRLRGHLRSTWRVTYRRIWQWCYSHWPRETELTHNQYQELAQLAGLRVEDDFLANLTGEIGLAGRFADGVLQAGLHLGVVDAARMGRGFRRAARWGAYYRDQGLAAQVFAPDPETGGWVLDGGVPGSFTRFVVESTALKLATDPAQVATLSPAPVAVGDFVADLAPTPAGLAVAVRWRKGADLATFGQAAKALGQAFAQSGSTSPAPSLAAVGLRAIITAEVTYRVLGLGRFNGLARNAYQREFWRLETDCDSQGEPLAALPYVIGEARYPDGIPLMGVRFAPVDRVADRPVDWTRECAFAALADGEDGGVPGVYAARADGVVYHRRDLQTMPTSLPADFEAAGWQRVTARWVDADHPPTAYLALDLEPGPRPGDREAPAAGQP